MQSFTIDGLVVLPPLTLNYSLDSTLDLKHNVVSFEQGLSFDYHNILNNSQSVSFNKHSNFYLTDEQTYTDSMQVTPIGKEYPITHGTFLSFNTLHTDPMSAFVTESSCLTSLSSVSALSAVDNNTQYITINPSINIQNDTGVETRSINVETFIDIKTGDTLYQNYYFTVMLINAHECVVYHQDNDTRWYLSHIDGPEEVVKFTKIAHDYGMEYDIDQIREDGGSKIIFKYTLLKERNMLRLFKQFNGTVHILRMLSEQERVLHPEAVPVRLEEMLNADKDSDITTNKPNLLELTQDTVMRMRPITSKPDPSVINTRVVQYSDTHNNNALHVKPSRETELINNLINSEYYFLTGETLPINFMPLKNQFTSEGVSNSNNKLTGPRKNHHRRYNKLYTGSNQQSGSTNIMFDYTCESITLTFEPGINYFNTPNDMGMYKKININDTTLYRSGSIAANHPAMSDKIYKKRSNYSNTTRWGNPTDPHTGTWLCTWLSGSDDPNVPPVWMDRYYIPSDIGYVDALTSRTDHVYSTFEIGELYVHNNTDTTTTTTTGTTALSALTATDLPNLPPTRVTNSGNVYDEPSKLTLEPGCHYAYYRLNKIDIVNNLSTLDPYHLKSQIEDFRDESGQTIEVVDKKIILDGKKHGKIYKIDNDVDYEQLSIDFDINFTDIRKPIGHQIIGNSTNKGVGFFNKNDVSPFLFIPGADGQAVDGTKQGSSIRLYDNTYKLYNYITNDSFLHNDDRPGLFKDIIIRELCEDIYTITTTGIILQITHDGVIVSSYDHWNLQYGNIENATIADTAYDEKFIYILTHINTSYYIDVFNMDNKSFSRFDSHCIVHVPVPDEFKIEALSEMTNYGRYLNSYNLPPSKIYVKDDPPPFHNKRSVYLGYGDQVKAGQTIIWYLVKGQISQTTGYQEKHDLLYGFDTKSMKLIPGKITNNNLNQPDLPLEIIDYAIDGDGGIWVCHNTNYVTKFNKYRNIQSSHEIPEQAIMSMVINKDYFNREIVEQVVVLSKTIGEEELQLQVGPFSHPTNDPSSEDFRKASPWLETVLEVGAKVMWGEEEVTITRVHNSQETGEITHVDISIFSGEIFERILIEELSDYRYERPDFIEYDADIDSTQIIYPFVDGESRFGLQIENRYNITSSDIAGKVVNGDYQSVTEGFDFLVTEIKDEMYGNVFDVNTGKISFTRQMTDFFIDDANDKPQMQNHYEYSLQNYRQYSENNFNVKIHMQPLFKANDPDLVNLKVNLNDLKPDDVPYTGFVHFTLNIDNKKGCVELWINGTLNPDEHVYKFNPQKYRFLELLDRNILIGTSPFLQDTVLNNKLNDRSMYTCTGVEIRNFNIYNKCLDYHTQLNIMRQYDDIGPMKWDIPGGSRNYIDAVDKVFNHSIPPRKSNEFEIVLRNSSIEQEETQQYITNKLNNILKDIIPAGTNVSKITWANEAS